MHPALCCAHNWMYEEVNCSLIKVKTHPVNNPRPQEIGVTANPGPKVRQGREKGKTWGIIY